MTNRHRYKATMRRHAPDWRRRLAELWAVWIPTAELVRAYEQPVVDEIHRRQLLYGAAWAELFTIAGQIETVVVDP